MKIRKSDVRWVRLENEDATATLRQHGYVPDVTRTKWYNELYIGNVSLCGSSRQGNENAEVDNYNRVKDEGLNKDKACKRCIEIYEKLK
jgi:hypothetical protein